MIFESLGKAITVILLRSLFVLRIEVENNDNSEPFSTLIFSKSLEEICEAEIILFELVDRIIFSAFQSITDCLN